MNNKQQEAVQQMRKEGQSYTKIADLLGISKNTIKSYCRRNNLGGVAIPITESASVMFCKKCGAPLTQTQGKKLKQYCSDQCRMDWWNAHPEAVTHKSIRQFTCQSCGQRFESYGKRERKFCSRACYGNSRVVRDE